MILVLHMAEFMNDQVINKWERQFDGIGVNNDVVSWCAASPPFCLLAKIQQATKLNIDIAKVWMQILVLKVDAIYNTTPC